MNNYIILEKQKDKVYGRISHTAETKGGIVVFPHYKNKDAVDEGFFKVDSISIKEKDDKKVGFISGTNIYPDKEIDIDNLSVENLHDLLSYGVIKNLLSYNGYQCIMVKEPTIIDSVTYLAFMVDGEFVFIKNLKYINSNLKFIKSLFNLQRNIHKKGLSNQYIASSTNPTLKNMSEETKNIIESNMENIIWRQISHDPNHPKYCILLYNCIKDKPFNNRLYSEIIKYNNSINELLRKSNILENYNEEGVKTLYKALSRYGYESI